MAKWEYAAIVSEDGDKWSLRGHGKMTKFECTIEFVFEDKSAYDYRFKMVKNELTMKKLAKVKGFPSKIDLVNIKGAISGLPHGP